MNKISITVCIVALLFNFVSCGKKTGQEQTDSVRNSVFSGVDKLENTVVLETWPERIISLAPSNTEIVCALGIGDRLVGRTRYSNYPPEINSVQVVGGFVDINVERILSLKPDLVLAVRGNPRKILNEIDRLGIKIFALDPVDIHDVVDTVNLVGKLTGTTETAAKVSRELSHRIQRVKDKIADIAVEKRPNVFYGDWKPPISAAGINNPIDSLITMAGGINICRDAGVPWPRYSFERILAHDPDIILSGFKNEKDLQKKYENLKIEIHNDPLWSKIKAVKTNTLYFIDEDIVMRPGPRMVDALEIMVHYFYPDMFPEPEPKNSE